LALPFGLLPNHRTITNTNYDHSNTDQQPTKRSPPLTNIVQVYCADQKKGIEIDRGIEVDRGIEIDREVEIIGWRN
jgi:hypothetical protein